MPDHIWAAWCGHTVAVNVATYTHARPEDLAAVGTGAQPHLQCPDCPVASRLGTGGVCGA